MSFLLVRQITNLSPREAPDPIFQVKRLSGVGTSVQSVQVLSGDGGDE